jgi:hypothetical protein
VLLHDDEQVLQLCGLAVQAVRVPRHDGVDVARLDVGQHPDVLLALPAAVGGGHVVVDVHLQTFQPSEAARRRQSSSCRFTPRPPPSRSSEMRGRRCRRGELDLWRRPS